MRTGILTLLLAENRYFDTPFIILYILAFLTLAVWCANLIIYLKKRKAKKSAVEDNTAIEEETEPTIEELAPKAKTMKRKK